MKETLKKFRPLFAVVALFAVLGLFTVVSCGPDTTDTVTTTTIGVGSTIRGDLFSSYKVLGIDNDGTSNLVTFAAGEDTDAIYLYYELAENYEKQVLFTTINDSANPQPLTGTYTWGWGETARNYGQSSNYCEIKISIAASSADFTGDNIVSNIESGNLQLMYTNGENKLLNEGTIVESMGDISGDGNVMEVKIMKTALTNAGAPKMSDIANLSFLAGTFCITGWGMPSPDGFHEAFPSENAWLGANAVYFLSYTDPSSASYLGGNITGSVTVTPSTVNGTVAAILATNVTVEIVDPDSSAASKDVTMEIVNSASSIVVSNVTVTLTGSDGEYSGSLAMTTNVASASASTAYFEGVAGNTTTIKLIYTDAETSAVSTNSFTVQPFKSFEGEALDGTATSTNYAALTGSEATGDMASTNFAPGQNSGCDLAAMPQVLVGTDVIFVYFPLPEANGDRHIELDVLTNDAGGAVNSWGKPRQDTAALTMLSWDGTGAGIGGLNADVQGASHLLIDVYGTDTGIEYVLSNVGATYKIAAYTAEGGFATGNIIDMAGTGQYSSGDAFTWLEIVE